MGSVFVAIPVIIFAVVWNQFAVNVPKWDDHALRAFLYNYDQETTVSGKIYQFFRQHNEHRIVYDRIVAFLDFHLTGKLNYRHLMAVGNLSLVGLLAVFVAVLHRANRSVWYAVPVALVLFNLSQWENMFWGMAALQNFSVVLWVVAALYWLTYSNRWGLGIASAIFATLTSGNGLIVWPVGIVLQALRVNETRRTGEKSFGSLLVWILCSVVSITLYFVGFEKPAGNPPLRGSAIDLLNGWLAFIGAAAEALPINPVLRSSTLLGGLMVLATLGIMGRDLLTYRNVVGRTIQWFATPGASVAGKGNLIPALTLFFWGCAAFILGTAAVVAWTRTGFGADLLITSRYKIYSLTLLALLYVYLAATVQEPFSKWVLAGGIGGGFLVFWCSYLSFLDDTIWFRHWQLANQFNWTYETNQPVAKSDSITRHYTDPSPAFYDAALPTLYGPTQSQPIPLTLTKLTNRYSVQTTNLPITLPTGIRPDAGEYIVARSAKRSYLFPVWPNQRTIRQARFLPANLFTTGFRADVWESELQAGTYQLLVLTVSANNQCRIYPTNQQITTAGQPTDIQKNW